MPEYIETNEGTASESVTTKHRVREVSITPDRITFFKHRIKEVGGDIVRCTDGVNITREIDAALLSQTVVHGGLNVTFQTAVTLLRKFHDKWKTEDGS